MSWKISLRLEDAAAEYPEFTGFFQHAAALAREAEHLAERSSIEAMSGVSPAYPPLLQLLDEELERQGH